MAAGDIFRLQLHTHTYQRQFINVLHYRETVDDTNQFPGQNLADAWSSAFITGLQPVYSTDMFFGCLKVNMIVGSGDGRIPGVTYYQDIKGTSSGEAMIGNTVARINFFAQNHSRTIRGGMNLSGIARGQETTNGPSTIIMAAIQAGWLDKLPVDVVGAGPSTGEWEFVMMSRAPADPVDPPIPWPGVALVPDNFTISPFFSTLRSRQGTYTNVQT